VGSNMAQDATLLVRAKQMRHEATPFEVILWRHLNGSKLGGFKFRRQHVIERCVVDFFCPAKKLIVEVDGETHDPERDGLRDRQLQAYGYKTLRFTNTQVANELEAVLQVILDSCSSLPERWLQSATSSKEASEIQISPSLSREG
jgi:very-short-patch-repair endonuclease